MAESPEFAVVLLGSDDNVYGIARSFHERYGTVATVYAREQFAPTRYSKIVAVHLVADFDQDAVFTKTLMQLTCSKPTLLLPCGDAYASLVATHKQELATKFLCPTIDATLLAELADKERFYQLCADHGIAYPATRIVTPAMAASGVAISSPYAFPVMLKPADSLAWHRLSFEGVKKAYLIHSQVELNATVQKAYANGYRGNLILQDFIPGDDSQTRVLNAYVTGDHRVKMMCLGHPLLEDPTPNVIGSYVAILPAHDQTLYDQFAGFLEAIGYVGFANIDLKYDVRDSQFKILDLNLRPGRSAYYVTLNGYNLAQWPVAELIDHTLASEPPVFADPPAASRKLWLGVPKKVFATYASGNPAKADALRLIAAGQVGTTVFYDGDMSFRRWVLMTYMFHNYYGRFRQYFAENKGGA
ncbi:carboxylate--amine ligase [Lacticaseibacillus parakribbianus]|uniref:carboxylate--amine ligase n=1 Tax=Lacticaseibacillus parakribbianus TaxID=2970927 RepID=UPI0021CB5B3A|nr:carboxylate--amine ligase [Lacticaseibacillus parakribbianus]